MFVQLKTIIWGIFISRSTRLYSFGLKLYNANAGSLNASTSNPTRSKAIFSIVVISGSSSTNKIFFFLLLDNSRDFTDVAISDYIVYYDSATSNAANTIDQKDL